ncbi:MAG: DUF1122 family protein [Solirubrobacteraceae bacterium]
MSHGIELREAASRPGRTHGERRVVLAGPDGEAARGLWCDGMPEQGIRPWADLETADPRALGAIARRLGPGGSIMVAYGTGETERALRRRVPPAASPLGLALVAAGCRWLKDWYFAEGGREGAPKLQGTLPLDAAAAHRSAQRLAAELWAFAEGSDVRAADRERATAALAILGADAESGAG